MASSTVLVLGSLPERFSRLYVFISFLTSLMRSRRSLRERDLNSSSADFTVAGSGSTGLIVVAGTITVARAVPEINVVARMASDKKTRIPFLIDFVLKIKGEPK